jgi:hypothetical protein
VVFGFAEEEVEVFGHQDVGVKEEVVGAAGSFDDLFEDLFRFGGVEMGKAVVTTEGDEVEMTQVVAAFEAQRHGLILMAGRGKRIVLSHDGPLMR